MTRRLNGIFRRIAPVLASGMLLQAGGCNLDLNTLAAGLVNSIVNSFITSFVFGAFNLGTF